jgi:WG containing repeat
MNSPILQFDNATNFSKGLAVVQTADRYFYINPTGKTVIAVDPSSDCVSPFSDGRAIACVNDYYGYLDRTSAVAIDPQYSGVNFDIWLRRENF